VAIVWEMRQAVPDPYAHIETMQMFGEIDSFASYGTDCSRPQNSVHSCMHLQESRERKQSHEVANRDGGLLRSRKWFFRRVVRLHTAPQE
jgi:hypothetical protein